MKAAPSVPVGFLHDAEDLKPLNYMLYRWPDPSEVTVVRSLVVGERLMFARLFRRPGQGVLVMNALIPGISEEFGVRVDGCFRLPQESKIMRRPTTRGHAKDLARNRVHQELHF